MKEQGKQANAMHQASFPTSLQPLRVPQAIDCFELLRTISRGEIASILDPVAGRITYRQGHLHRDP